MPVIAIDTPRDPRIALYYGVSDPDLLRVHHAFVIEGRLVVRRFLQESRWPARSVLVTEPALASLRDVLAINPELPVYVAPQPVLNAVAGFNIHRGCLALGERPAPRAWSAILDELPPVSRVVGLDAVSNGDNVGGIFRSAAALGGDAVLLGPGCSDPLYRKSIRTSIGATLVVPFAGVGEWAEVADALRARGFLVLALTPADDAEPIPRAADALAVKPRLALLAGAEGDGLSGQAVAAADLRIRIPMTGGADSLNVTVAIGIALDRLRAPR